MRVRLLAALLVVPLLVLSACSDSPPVAAGIVSRTIPLTGDWHWVEQPQKLELGVTHTQNSLDSSEPDQARARGIAILRDNAAIWQNQHLMGFGTLNPEPSPGDFEWSSLDARMKLIRDTGGETVLTLCCAPDWMKGGDPGDTDWSKIERAPLPEHFQDFANLAAAAVQRYPQVKRVLVWNELKGFYNNDQNRWDYEGYTALYNDVYRAVKAVRPDVLVGGPYAVMTSVSKGSSELSGAWGAVDQRSLDIVTYWLAHNVGADFIAVDGSTSRQGNAPASIDGGARKFADVDAWLHQRTSLPIWWAEFYSDVPDGADAGPSSPASAAADLATVAAFARSGASGALKWGPEGSKDLAYAALWTNSTKSDGGQRTPLTSPWQWLVPRLAKGGVEVGHSPTKPLLAFRASDGVLVVNTSGDPVDVGSGEPLPAWGVALTSVGS